MAGSFLQDEQTLRKAGTPERPDEYMHSDEAASRCGPRIERPPVSRALRQARPGQLLPARRGPEELCVARTEDGRAFVMPDRCPHDGGLLSDGFLDGPRVVCARHGREFDLETGICPVRRSARIDVVEIAIDQPHRHRSQRGSRRGSSGDQQTGHDYFDLLPTNLIASR